MAAYNYNSYLLPRVLHVPGEQGHARRFHDSHVT
jgi:hypothetical protein